MATPARAATRQEVAQHWAPLLYQETNDPVKDLFAAFDFDGNWNGDDNAENMECWADASKCNGGDNPNSACSGQRCPLIATVYFTVTETATHWFVQYMPYHPLDWKLTNGHENDTESLLAVVAKPKTKTDGAFGALQVLETRFHLYWYQYAADPAVKDAGDNVDGPVHFDAASGRPAVYSQMVGHGLCGGFSPPNRLFPDLSLTCSHDQAPHLDQAGVVYSPDLPATMPVVGASSVNAGYRLVELYTSVWTHSQEIGAGKAFQAAMDYQGERCAQFSCPKQIGGNWEGNEGQSPGEPWAQSGGNGVSAVGDQFFDPAFTMSKRLAFPAPFSLDYCFNPYLGVADTCASVTDGSAAAVGDGGASDGGGAPADSSTSTGTSSGNDRGGGAATASAGGCQLARSSPRQHSVLALLLLGMLALFLRRTVSTR